MTVFVAFPTANTLAANETLAKWHALGYRSCVIVDAGQEHPAAEIVLELERGPYPGFPRTANAVIKASCSLGADIVVLAGDDIDPDPRFTAIMLASRFFELFPDTFGVMQPAGDRYGALADDASFPACVSPLIGADFARRINGGGGVYHEGYRDLFDDAELYRVASRLGVLALLPDVSQYHRHHSRGHEDHLAPAQRERICQSAGPDQTLYLERLAAKFPGHEPLPRHE